MLKINMSKDQADRSLRERVAMAMCGCDTFTMHRLTQSEDGCLHLPDDEGFVRREHVCVCTRDGRRPVATILRCADMLLKAEAALAVIHS